jgi:hypothetical protein
MDAMNSKQAYAAMFHFLEQPPYTKVPSRRAAAYSRALGRYYAAQIRAAPLNPTRRLRNARHNNGPRASRGLEGRLPRPALAGRGRGRGAGRLAAPANRQAPHPDPLPASGRKRGEGTLGPPPFLPDKRCGNSGLPAALHLANIPGSANGSILFTTKNAKDAQSAPVDRIFVQTSCA